MKKLLTILLSVILVVGMLPVIGMAGSDTSGECGADGAKVTWTLDGDGTLTIRGAGAMQDFLWGGSPWYQNSGVRTVRVERGVTSVGDYAFYGCSRLTEVRLPAGLQSVGTYAFCGCAALCAITLPESVKQIGAGAFYDCSGLVEAQVPAGVAEIPAYAFYGCAGMSALTLSEGLSSVGGSAFSGCAGLSAVLIPDSVTQIGQDAFPAQAILYGKADGAAQEWASGNGRAFSVKGGTKLTLSAPTFVSTTYVDVCGFADPGAAVTCYLNDKQTAVATADAGGKWNAKLPFSGLKNGDTVAVKATVTAADKTTTKDASVQYLPDAPAFRSLTLEHNYYTVSVTSDNMNTAKRNITMSAERPFSFRVAVSNSEKVKSLAVYSTRNGVAKTIPLVYDLNSDSWFGSGYFDNADHAYVPGILTVEGTDLYGNDINTGVSLKLNFLTEPAGYVYEAVRSNKVEGAAAAVYYRDETGRDRLWNAASTEQVNPAPTLPDGSFTWAVPKGTWQIRVSKDGYQSAASEWMVVPPGSDQVFLPLVTKKAPIVEELNVYEDRAEIRFSSYMDIASVNTRSVTFAGYIGELVPLDAEESEPGSGVYYARTFCFTPDIPFVGAVNVTVAGVKNYAGVAMAEDFSAAATIAAEPAFFTATDAIAIACDDAAEITVSAENAAGKTVSASVSNGIATLSDEILTLDENGAAKFTVTGRMPGFVNVEFRLNGTALTAKTVVLVAQYSAVRRLPGDVDGDGSVTSADARLALRIAVKLDDCEWGSAAFLAADVTGDGDIGPDDARQILRASVGLETL